MRSQWGKLRQCIVNDIRSVTYHASRGLSEVFLELVQSGWGADLIEPVSHRKSGEVSPLTEHVEQVSEVTVPAGREPIGDNVRTDDGQSVIDPVHAWRASAGTLVVEHRAAAKNCVASVPPPRVAQDCHQRRFS